MSRVCSTCKLIKRKKKLSSMNKSYEKKHSQNILHVDVLYNIKRKKYKTVCAEVTFDRMVMILYRTYNSFSLFAMTSSKVLRYQT